jgi:hypothetical protein
MMATYSGLFDVLGLREWCDADKKPSLMSLARLRGEEAAWYEVPFPAHWTGRRFTRSSPT